MEGLTALQPPRLKVQSSALAPWRLAHAFVRSLLNTDELQSLNRPELRFSTSSFQSLHLLLSGFLNLVIFGKTCNRLKKNSAVPKWKQTNRKPESPALAGPLRASQTQRVERCLFELCRLLP